MLTTETYPKLGQDEASYLLLHRTRRIAMFAFRQIQESHVPFVQAGHPLPAWKGIHRWPTSQLGWSL